MTSSGPNLFAIYHYGKSRPLNAAYDAFHNYGNTCVFQTTDLIRFVESSASNITDILMASGMSSGPMLSRIVMGVVPNRYAWE